MIQKPGHLQFDDSTVAKAASKTPKAVEFGEAGAAGTAEYKAKKPDLHAPRPREPAALFNAGEASIAPAIDYARATFPDLSAIHEPGIDRKIRQLVPWKHETVTTWGSKALDENAVVTTKAAQLISRFSEYKINELVERATVLAQRGESGFLNRLFLRGKVISFKPALKVAKTQLTQLTKDCGDYISSIEPLRVQLSISLVALVSAYEALTRPAASSIDTALHSRRMLLQQAIHQAELTSLQLHELKQQIAMQLSHVDQLLMITIPAFEIANAAK